MAKLRSKHRFPLREYAVAVTTKTRDGYKTRYFYGRRLKDAVAAAGKAIPNGRVFSYARFERQTVTVASKTAAGWTEHR